MEDQENILPAKEFEVEPVGVRLAATTTAVAEKVLLPSVATYKPERFTRDSRGWQLSYSVGAAMELYGVSQTASGQEVGPAWYVAGKLVSLVSESRANSRWLRQRKENDEPIPSSLEQENTLVEISSKATAVAAKVLLPTVLSGGKVEGKGYKLLRDAGIAAESASLLTAINGNPEVSGALYAGGRMASLFAEGADRGLPKVKSWAKEKFGGAGRFFKEKGAKIKDVAFDAGRKTAELSGKGAIGFAETIRRGAKEIDEKVKDQKTKRTYNRNKRSLMGLQNSENE